jgi:hypothetical protein
LGLDTFCGVRLPLTDLIPGARLRTVDRVFDAVPLDAHGSRLIETIVSRVARLGVHTFAGRRVTDAVVPAIDVVLDTEVIPTLVGLVVAKRTLQAHRIHALTVSGVDTCLGLESAHAPLTRQRAAEFLFGLALTVDAPFRRRAIPFAITGILHHALPGGGLAGALLAGLVIAAIRPTGIVIGTKRPGDAVDGLETPATVLADPVFADPGRAFFGRCAGVDRLAGPGIAARIARDALAVILARIGIHAFAGLHITVPEKAVGVAGSRGIVAAPGK